MKTTTFGYLFETFITCCFLFSAGYTYAQSQFALAIGGSNNEHAYSMVQTPDGGYVLGGTSTPPGTFDHKMYAVKINSTGSMQWSRIVENRWITSLVRSDNGSFLFSGLGGGGICLIELDGSGALQWNGLIPSDGDSPTDIKRTTDGGYLITGSNSKLAPEIYIAKFNASKTLRWERVIAVGNVDYVSSITETTDQGCIAAGATTPGWLAPYDMYITKLDSSGSAQWNRSIGGAGHDHASSIIQTTDGGFIVAGYTWSFGTGGSDMYVVRLDAGGTLQWSKTIGWGGDEYARTIIQTSDGGYAIAGSTLTYGAGSSDFYIVKLSADGNLQWSRTVGGTGSDNVYSIIQTVDGGFVVSGSTNSFGNGNFDMFIVKLNSKGISCLNSTSPSSIVTDPASQVTVPAQYVTNTISGLTNPSSVSSTGGSVSNLCLVGIEPVSNEIPEEFRIYQNYPNPFNPKTRISFDLPKPSIVKLDVYDVNGKLVSDLINEDLKAGTYSFDFDGSNLSSGVYFYRVIASGFNEVKKMVLVK